MTLPKKWVNEYKKKGLELSIAIDEFGNFLNENPLEGYEDVTEVLLESLHAISDSIIKYTKLVKSECD